MRIKFFVFVAVLATAILCSGGLVNAQTIDNSALIAQLRAQIQALMQQIAALQAQQGTTPAWCHTFNKNLGIGSSGPDFDALITVLDKEGIMEFISTNKPAQYNEAIAGGVSAIQQKYASEILTPSGLKYPTGYVGPSTRAKLNAIYGCGTTQPSITVISPNGGETITAGGYWTIKWIGNNLSTDYSNVEINLLNNGSLYRTISGCSTVVNNSTTSGITTCLFPSDITAGSNYKLVVIDKGANVSDSSDNTFSIVASTTNHDHKSCYDSDVYWYDSNNNRNDLYQDCGEDVWTNNYQCLGSSYLQRQGIDKRCSNATCSAIDYWVNYEDCSSSGQVCQNNQCSSATPSITVTYPNKEENWIQNTSQTVLWTSSNIPSSSIVKIIARKCPTDYLSDICTDYVLRQSATNDGTEKIDITGLPTGRYAIQIKTTINNVVIDDWSDSYFKIIAAPTTGLNVSQSSLASIADAIARIAAEIQAMLSK